MTLRLYDLAGAEPDRRFSPYCWRTRMALAHKGLAFDTIPWRFTEKAEIAPSGQKLVPVLVDGDRWVADSWTIANYLEDTYPDAPSLFGGSSARRLTRHYSSLADGLVAAIFPFVALDILQHLAEKDRAYFRESRERRVGKPLCRRPRREASRFSREPDAVAPDAEGAAILRRRRATLCRLCRVRPVSMGTLHQLVPTPGGGRSGQAVA
jgi:hypothetical protein